MWVLLTCVLPPHFVANPNLIRNQRIFTRNVFRTMNYLKQLTSALAVAMAVTTALPAMASDHLDAPSLSGNGQVDINDLYAFRSPENSDNTILILTVNPGAGALSPTNFAENTSYQFRIDNTGGGGDGSPDITYEAQFTGTGATQTLNLTRNDVAVATGATNTALPVLNSTSGAVGRVSTGVFDDPFFFDLDAFNAQGGPAFTDPGTDFFAGLDVSAIVLEVPSSELNGADTSIGVWARTLDGNGDQIDRVGRPAINTVLIAGDANKELFNVSTTSDDFTTFGSDVEAVITSLGAADPAGLTATLLPDVLTFNTAPDADVGFLNGRSLADDVIDAELNLLTDGGITGDGVDFNDRDFLDVFPFLASANAVPEPSGLLPIALGLFAVASRRRRS